MKKPLASNASLALAETSKKRRLHWTLEVRECLHCRSSYFDRAPRKLCVRCSWLVTHREAIVMWEPSDVQTWNTCPQRYKDEAVRSPYETAIRFRKNLISNIESQLAQRIFVEDLRTKREYPDGHVIEAILCHLTGGIIGKRKSRFYGHEGAIQLGFDEKQRHTIWTWLNEMHELSSRPTNRIWQDAWNYACDPSRPVSPR